MVPLTGPGRISPIVPPDTGYSAWKTGVTGKGRMSTRTGRTPVTAIGEPELILPRALRRRKCNRACL